MSEWMRRLPTAPVYAVGLGLIIFGMAERVWIDAFGGLCLLVAAFGLSQRTATRAESVFTRRYFEWATALAGYSLFFLLYGVTSSAGAAFIPFVGLAALGALAWLDWRRV